MGKYTKSKTSRKTMKKKQMKKSKSLNNKKTHKKTGGIAGYDIRGKAAETLGFSNKDAFKLKDKGIVKGTKDALFTEKKPVDIILQIDQYGKPEDISLNSNNYFIKEDDIKDNNENSEIDVAGIPIKTNKIDKLLLHKLQFRDEKFDQRLFKEYNITYYEKNSKNDTEDTSKKLTGVGNSPGVYAKYNNINIQQKEATLRLPFIINKVFRAKSGSYGDKVDSNQSGNQSIYMQYQVPLKWALEKYLNLNKYGVTETNNNTDPLPNQINRLFNCFDKDKDHVWDNEAWKFTEGAVKNITLNRVKINYDGEYKKCPKVSERDNLLKLLTIKPATESDDIKITKEDIWITITELVDDALIGVRSKTNLHDKHSNRIELFQTLPSDKKHSVTKTTKKEYIESVNFDARKIFNRQAEWSYKYRPSYNTKDKILAANNAQGFGLEKGYLYDVRSSFNIGKNIPSKEWLSTFPYNKLQENKDKELNESAENKK
jgi:hypothetical protein